jgi:hypothetical protein
MTRSILLLGAYFVSMAVGIVVGNTAWTAATGQSLVDTALASDCVGNIAGWLGSTDQYRTYHYSGGDCSDSCSNITINPIDIGMLDCERTEWRIKVYVCPTSVTPQKIAVTATGSQPYQNWARWALFDSSCGCFVAQTDDCHRWKPVTFSALGQGTLLSRMDVEVACCGHLPPPPPAPPLP